MLKFFLTNSSGILFSRILGFVRDLLMASVLGANVYSDIFFVAFKLPNLFRRIFAEGAFTQAFIPAFANAKYKTRFSFEVLYKISFIIIVLTILVNIFSYSITSIIAFGFSKKNIELAAPFVAINFYYLFAIFLVSFLAALLQYKKHFATTAYATALLNISLIVSLLLAKNMQKFDIVQYLSYGVVVGGILQVVVHVLVSWKKGVCKIIACGFKSKKDASKDLEVFNNGFFPSILANSTAHISAFLDTFLASFLISGSISYLYYSNRILQLPLALFAIAISISLFPQVARSIKNKNFDLAHKVLEKSFWILSYLLAFSAIGGIIFSKEIMWLLFERGEFSRSDTLNSSLVLSGYMIGLLPFGLAKIFSLWHMSNLNQKKVAKFSAISLGSNIIFSLVLIVPFQAFGLALASSISGFVLFWLNFKEYKKYNSNSFFISKKGFYFALSSFCFIVLSILIHYKTIYIQGECSP